MAYNYEWENNPIRDYFLQLMLVGVDLLDKNIFNDIHCTVNDILLNVGVEKSDLKYLEFEFKKNKFGEIIAIPHNLVVAMWFIGGLPDDCDLAYSNNSTIFDGLKYTFNYKTKKLSWEKIKR